MAAGQQVEDAIVRGEPLPSSSRYMPEDSSSKRPSHHKSPGYNAAKNVTAAIAPVMAATGAPFVLESSEVPRPRPPPRNFTDLGMPRDKCPRLQHEIQDLLDAKKFELRSKPNVSTNPLPKHHTVNAIEEDTKEFDPTSLIIVKSANYDEDVVLLMVSTIQGLGELSGSTTRENEVDGLSDQFKYDIYIPGFDSEVREVKIEPDTEFEIYIPNQGSVMMHDACESDEVEIYIPGEVIAETRSGKGYKPTGLMTDISKATNDSSVQQDEQRRQVPGSKQPEPKNQVLKQLQKTQANISIWGLLMAPPIHGEAVLKALASTQVPIETGPTHLANLVGATYVVNSMTFSDMDLPLEGSNHTKALHITIDCQGCRIPQVLVDEGSALNVFPLRTFKHLGFDEAGLKPSSQGVRAYDNMRRNVLGVFLTVIVVGPVEFEVDFQVIDIPATFNMILGRPWLHKTGAISSSLHQKIKFLHQGKMITIMADRELFNTLASIETRESSSCTLRTPEIRLSGFELNNVGAIFGPFPPEEKFALVEFKIDNPFISCMLIQMGYFLGSGLGKYQQGDASVLVLTTNAQHFGLGYEPTKEDLWATTEKALKYQRSFEGFEKYKYKEWWKKPRKHLDFGSMFGSFNNEEVMKKLELFTRQIQVNTVNTSQMKKFASV
ncbi:uncharacterized protein LOC122639153 [Telopea speciosissima]|uniref:uncharacterized protein LOC122639153 n=1 Tax=Telopea speciosissima TaxID=54955 RepID=UPI001CC7BD93|nr:uncharacterized protein LOC122639153 [Telopea speciosissima]